MDAEVGGAGLGRRAVLTGLLRSMAAGAALAVALASRASDMPQEDAPAPTGDAALFATPTTLDHIGRVVVPVMVNGRGPFRFVVDTGANHSTISTRLAKRLGLTPTDGESITLDGITGAAQVNFVTVEKLQAGDLTISDTPLPVIGTPVMAGADGILGAAGLDEKSVLMDFQRNRVVISRNVDYLVRTESTRIHADRLRYGLVTIDTRVGGVLVRAVIDTGSERTLGNLALRDALRTRRGPGVLTYVTSVFGATEKVEPGEIQPSPPIVIDPLRITDVNVVYGAFHIFDVWGLRNRPALIIGMDVLGTVASLAIDFKNQDVYITPARAGADTLPANLHDLVTAPAQKR